MTSAHRSEWTRRFIAHLRSVMSRRSDRRLRSTGLPSRAELPDVTAAPRSSRTAQLISRLCDALLVLHDPFDAWRLAHLAVKRFPMSARAWDAVGDATAALSAAAGDPVAADRAASIEIAARARSLALDPSGHRRAALGDAYRRSGDFDRAEQELSAGCANGGSAEDWYRLGRLQADRAARMGGYTAHGFDTHHAAMAHALRLDPAHQSARYHLLRVAYRSARWDVAFGYLSSIDPHPTRAAAHATEALLHAVPAPDLDAAVSAVEPSSVPPEWWLTAHWRLLQLGQVRLAYVAKSHYAERLDAVVRGPEQTAWPTPSDVTRYIQVRSCLGEHDRGLDAIDYWSHRRQLASVHHVLERLRRDLRLDQGDPDEWHRVRPRSTDDSAFRDLIRGKTVAVVGPSESNVHQGAAIDAHDIVIRTKYTTRSALDHDTQGSRTDIAYYAERAVALLWPDIRQTLDIGALQLAVVRATDATLEFARRHEHRGIRIMPHEFGALLEAGQFAVQRILYDLASASPAGVDVYNVDLYTSSVAYDPAYHIDDRPLAERALVANLDGYGHDLRADHRFIRAARTAGFIGADARLSRVLDLSESGYLAAVEAARQAG
jgi:hypothetical protein